MLLTQAVIPLGPRNLLGPARHENTRE